MRRAPPPPKVGQKFKEIGPLGQLHHVRGVVDAEQTSTGWRYRVVMRYWSPRRGWRYVVEGETAFMIGLFVPHRRNRINQPRKDRHP